jgi:beta-alanine--pyruvate transaminase
MRMWDKGFYARYGGDTVQLGLPFVTSDSEIEQICAALGESLLESA